MLIVALGLVLAVMRQLDQPATVERLGQFFGANQPTTVEPEQPFAEIEPSRDVSNRDTKNEQIVANHIVVENTEQSDEVPVASEDTSVDLSGIRDQTYFRPEERQAWFALLGEMQGLSKDKLTEETVGELTYAQLLQQPEVYRGRIVTLQGTVLREESQQPGDNPLGIAEYHRLWIQPLGGGQWPFVVYCLRLPEDFPRGDAIRAQVSVRGFFFKNWSYPWDDGLGLAPVVLADLPDWEVPTPVATRRHITEENWVVAIAIACVFAVGFTWFAVSRTRRRVVRPELAQLDSSQVAGQAEEEDA